MGPPHDISVLDPSSSKHSANSRQKKSARPQHKQHPPPSQNSSNALPGVQKIKAALRQTRRLLAKDTLAADVRVATERRLRSLESDLAKAEQARTERTMATRYHKIKFFERQKVVRRISQTKKTLAAATEKKERKKLEARLAELRVDLNYILHYPKTKKYISLFPPEVRQGYEPGDAMRGEKEKGKAETDEQREGMRQWMREQMDAGTLSWEPEVDIGRLDERTTSAGVAKLPDPRTSDGRVVGAKEKVAADSGRSRPTGQLSKGGGVADDDFFAQDEESVEEGSEDSSEEDSDDDSSMSED